MSHVVVVVLKKNFPPLARHAQTTFWRLAMRRRHLCHHIGAETARPAQIRRYPARVPLGRFEPPTTRVETCCSVGGVVKTAGMGVRGSGDAAKSALNRPVPSDPHAHAPTPGAHGFWVIQVKPGPPLGWVTARSAGNGPLYHCYAYCRDASGRRPWLQEFDSLNSAVA